MTRVDIMSGPGTRLCDCCGIDVTGPVAFMGSPDAGGYCSGCLAAALSAIKRAERRGRPPSKAGGRARAARLTPEERSAIARKGAAARWGKEQ